MHGLCKSISCHPRSARPRNLVVSALPLGREVASTQGIDLFPDRRTSSVHAVVHTNADELRARLVDAGSKNGLWENCAAQSRGAAAHTPHIAQERIVGSHV